MNYSSAIFLVNSKVRCVAGIYEKKEELGKPPVARTFFKTMDDTIKVGDYVLVPTTTRHHMTVNLITEVDCEVDFESSTPMGWVIETIDRREYEQTNAMENAAIERIKSAEKNRRREELKAALLKDNPEIQALAVTYSGGAPEQPPSA